MKLIGGVFVFLLILAILATPLGFMFEYCLSYWIKKDVPFWLDMLGGIATNGILFVVWVVTMICDFAGYVSPLV